MATIVTRSGKGSPLTNNEVDANFTNLNTELGTKANTSSLATVATTGAYADLTGKPTIASADGSVVVTGTTNIDLSVGVAGSTANVVLPIRNTTGATLAKGTAVYISGATGQISTVSKAIATGDATSAQTLGLVTANIANNSNGNVTLIGTITNIDTSAYTDGQQLYLSPTTAGTLTATKPYAPQHLVYVAVVEHAHPSQGKLFVKVQNGYEMDELHDVSAQNPANNDGLFYNTSTSLWEKKSIPTALGFTPYNATNPAGYITGITSGNVTTALGYTPYNATNPSGYITSAGSISGNAATATNISNTGTVTLASATESNSIYATAPSYGADQPTKLLNFDWYSNVFSLGNIRSTSTDSNGFGVYYTATGGSRTELARFFPNGNFGIGTITAPERLTIAGNIRIGNAGEPNAYNINIVGRSPAAGTIDWDFKTNDATYGARTAMTISATGSVVANFDVRAPIFYDSNNTGYYVDAASNSALYQLTTGVGINLNGGIALVASGATLANSIGARLTESYGPVWNLGDGATWHHQVINGSMLCGFSALGTNWGSGNIIANGYLRGTLFYDQSDTAYYVDPNSLSNLVTIYATKTAANNTPAIQVRGGYAGYPRIQTYGLDNDPNAWMGLGTDMAGGPYEHSIYFPNGSFGTQGNGRLSIGDYNGTTYNPRLWVYPTYTQINNSTRSPLFYDSDNTGYYVDPNGVTRINKLTAGERSLVGYSTISMSGLDANTWYPVTIPVPVARQTTLRIENALNSNAPSWSTHPSGFSCYIEWTTNGLGWGTIGISRRVTDWREQFTTVQIVGGITQLGNGSTEVIWLRGGANYFFSADCDVTPTIRTTLYDLLGQTVEPRSTVFNDPWATAVGKMSYGTFQANERVTAATDIRAPIFYDSNDTGYFLDPTSNATSMRTAGSWITNPTSTWGGDVAAKLEYHNNRWYASVNTAFVVRSTTGSEVLWAYNTGVVEASNDFRAPIFYDSNNTAYYINPNGTSQVSGANFNFGATGRVYDDGNFHIDGLSSPVWINSIGNSTIELNTQTSGYVNIGNSARAPIYYDSANTAYYVDPASTSNLVGLTVANTITGSITGTAAKATDLDQARYVNNDFNTLGTSPQVFRAYTNYIPSGGSYNQPTGGGQDFKVLQWGDVQGGTSGNWGGQIVQNFYDDRMWFRRSYATTWQAWREFIHDGNYTNYAMPSGASATNSVDVRAPIFYDTDNTGYYLNFASGGTSNVYTYFTGLAYFKSDFGSSAYSGAQSNPVLQALSTDAGTAMFSFHRAGHYAVNMGLDPDNYLRIGGWSAAANRWVLDMSGNNWAAGSFRAPVFYDSDDTGYYLDAASTSRINQINYTALYNASNTDYGIVGNNGFFDTVNSGVDADALELCYVRGSEVRIGTSGGNKAIRASLFYKGTNTAYFVNPDGTSILNTVSVAQNNGVNFNGAGSTYIIGTSTDNAASGGSNLQLQSWFGIGFGPTISGQLVPIGENAVWIDCRNGDLTARRILVAQQDARAPRFYDSGNTGYYVDPASDTNLNKTFTYLGGRDTNGNWNTGFQNTPPASYNFHGDISSGGPSGTWWFYESMRHSNASNYWGTQIAWGWEDNSNRLQQRNVSGNSFSAWVEYLNTGGRTFSGGLEMTGIIQSVADIRAPLYYDRNDTSYYVNPNGESVLSTLTVLGELNLSAGTTYVDHSGTIVFRNQANYVNSATLTTGGDFTASGNVTAYSDVRIKDNIKTIPNALDKLDLIRGVTYTRTDRDDKERRYAGVIAQEIEQVLPEAIFENEEYKSVDYNATIGLLIQAVKELRDEVEMLKK